jgi:hypothetical protein
VQFITTLYDKIRLTLGCSKNLKRHFLLLRTKKQPIKPKISSIEGSYQEKTVIFVEKITKCHFGNLRHFEIFPLPKIVGITVIFGQNFAF